MKRAVDFKKITISILRISIGWHFLYEGFSKLSSSGWSAFKYLSNAQGPLANLYHWLAASETLMSLVDPVNIILLLLIGIFLVLGIVPKQAAFAGFGLLALYYFAYPPFGGSVFNKVDGSLFVVNKIFVEAAALLLIAVQRDMGYGLYALKFAKNEKVDDSDSETKVASRREALKNLASIPALGLLGFGAFHERKTYSVNARSGATVRIKSSSLNELKGELPKGRVGKHQISRLVAGGNLIGGYSHARDLRYVSSLFLAYNTEKKIYETLMLAEQAGINTINIGFASNAILQKYKKVTGSKLQVISQVGPSRDLKDPLVNINRAIDYGVDIIQIQGNWCDWLVRDKRFDVIDKMMGYIRQQDYTAGLAAHTVDSLIECKQQGIIPDYYMKTMHHDNYWSAHPRENRKPFEVDGKKSKDHDQFHDNLFCLYPDKTVEFVKNATVPVMGFKVLAAGALKPQDGFKWAFENGADFICVGMFDFQIVDDVNTTLDVLAQTQNRERKWYG
jgi:uncharacterized membrane protein YphA (DoxX/SURF4 family)